MFGQDDNTQQQPQGDNGAFGAPASDPTSAPAPDPNWGMPAPLDDVPAPAPVADLSAPEMPADGTPDPAPTPAAPAGDLVDIKQQALQHLSPLVGHLDQTPEEKFRTTMMMIQASDDQSLIKTAFEAAQQISDDKARAQALLDVINEINYFTQHQAPTNS